MASASVSNLITERILAWLLSRRDLVAPVDSATGRHLLPYGPTYRRVILCLLVVSAGFLVLGVLGTMDDPQALAITAAVFGALFGGSLWAFYESRFVTIGFSEQGIFKRGLGQEVWTPWCDVTRIDFSESMKWFRFHTRSQGKVRVSVYRNGLKTLSDVVGGAPLKVPADEAVRILREKAGCPA